MYIDKRRQRPSWRVSETDLIKFQASAISDCPRVLLGSPLIWFFALPLKAVIVSGPYAPF